MKIKDPKLRDQIFRSLLKQENLPEPVAEYEFHASRKWRFDYFWPEQGLALEVDGGVFSKGGGRHNRGAGYRDDLEKRNAAAIYGYRLIACLPEQLCTMRFRTRGARCLGWLTFPGAKVIASQTLHKLFTREYLTRCIPVRILVV